MTNPIYKLQKIDKMILPSVDLDCFKYITICDATHKIRLVANHSDALYKKVQKDLGSDAEWKVSSQGDYITATIGYNGNGEVRFSLSISFEMM